MLTKKVLMNEELNIAQKVRIFSTSEMIAFKNFLLSFLHSFESKTELQRKEKDILSHELLEMESFICLDEADPLVTDKLEGYTLNELAENISSIFSMLGKKNKTELDYRDILHQREVLISSLVREFPRTKIELPLMECEITFDRNYLAGINGVAIYSKQNLDIHGVIMNGPVRKYLKEQRNSFGQIVTDGYISLFKDILESNFSIEHLERVRPFLKYKYADLIDRFGLASVEENEISAHELKQLLLAFYDSKSDAKSLIEGKNFKFFQIRHELCEA